MISDGARIELGQAGLKARPEATAGTARWAAGAPRRGD
jgi:hypothetical protein